MFPKFRRQSTVENTVHTGASEHESIRDKGEAQSVHGVNGSRGSLTAESVPGDDYGWLNLSLKENNLKICSLLFDTEIPTSDQVASVDDLIQFFVETLGFCWFGQVAAMSEGSFKRIERKMNDGIYSITAGTWTKFETFCKKMKAIVEAKKAAPHILSLVATVGNFFARNEEFCMSNVTLDSFVPNDTHPETLKSLLQGTSPIAILPKGEDSADPETPSKAVSLLLSGLETSQIEQTLYNGLRSETTSHIVALFGVPGIGKTRRIFEILSKEFGFYFLCGYTSVNVNAAQDSGASLFANVMGVAKKKMDSICENDDEDGSMRLQIVAESVRLGILVCCIVLCELKKRFPEMTPLQWLLIVLFPNVYLGEDVFNQLWDRAVEDMFCVDKSVLETYMTDNLNHLGKLWLFVDEAQILKKLLPRRFPCTGYPSKPKDTHDLLSAVCKVCQDSVNDCLRGAVFTGIRMTSSVTALANGADKETIEMKLQFTEMEPLDVNGVRAYMARYLNLNLVEDWVVSHCCSWLQGRPKWVASFIQVLVRRMMVEYELPINKDLFHPFFDEEYWENLKSENPVSAEVFACLGEFVREMVHTVPISNYVDTARSHIVNFKKRLNDMEYCLWIEIKRLGFLYMTRGRPATISDDVEYMKYVEEGLCCFHYNRMYNAIQSATKRRNNRHISLCEPLMVEAFALEVGVSSLCTQRLEDCIGRIGNRGLAETFETISIPIIEGLFHGDNPDYCQTTGSIVTSMIGKDKMPSHFSGDWTLCMRSYGAYFSHGNTKKDVTRNLVSMSKVLFDGQYPPLFKPGKLFGADLTGLVKQVGTNYRRFINVQLKYREKLSNSDCHKVHLTTIPELIWKAKRSNATTPVNDGDDYKALRIEEGIFRVVIVSPGKIGTTTRKNKEMRVTSRCIQWKPCPDSFADESKFTSFTKDVDTATHSHYDCLMVVDGNNLDGFLKMVQEPLNTQTATFLDVLRDSKLLLKWCRKRW